MSRVGIFRSTVLPECDRFRNVGYKELKLTTPEITYQEAYDLLIKDEFQEVKDRCVECGSKSKFVSLKLGYSAYCSEACYDLNHGYRYEELVERLKEGFVPKSKQFRKIYRLFGLDSEGLLRLTISPLGCVVCNSPTTFISYEKKWREYCGAGCSLNFKYFIRTPDMNKLIQQKRRQTSQLKWGVDCNLQLLDTRGSLNVMSKDNLSETSKKAKIKKRNTMVERFGVEYAFQSDELFSKYKRTMVERWGAESSLESIELSKRVKLTNLEKYGVEFPLQSQKIRDVITSNCLAEHNVDHPAKVHLTNYSDFTQSFIDETFIQGGKIDLLKCSEYFSCTPGFIRKSFDLPSRKNIGEEWLYELLSDGGEFIERNSRTFIPPKEVDLLVAAKRLAIEYNGLMFHSRGISEYSMFNNPNRKCTHSEKTDSVEACGFQLLHVFEDEFINPRKRKIWECIIKDLINPKQISETVSEITSEVSSSFVLNHYLADCVSSDVQLGAFESGKLKAVMNFKTAGNGWLITEHAYVNSSTFKPLVDYFVELHDPRTLTIELDRRWNTKEHACVNSGFELEEVKKPKKWYFKQTELSLISECNFSLEHGTAENAIELGFREIKDSGSLIFKKTFR